MWRPGITRAETVLKRVSRDEERWAQQLFREKAAMDYRSGMGAAWDESRQEGEAAGLAKGKAIGYDQARLEYEAKLVKAERTRLEHEQRLAKAERARLEHEAKLAQAEQEKLGIARKMKARGWSVADIADDTGLAPEAIAEL